MPSSKKQMDAAGGVGCRCGVGRGGSWCGWVAWQVGRVRVGMGAGCEQGAARSGASAGRWVGVRPRTKLVHDREQFEVMEYGLGIRGRNMGWKYRAGNTLAVTTAGMGSAWSVRSVSVLVV